LRKIILGLVATAAIAAPLALSAPADAATTCQDVPTTTGLATFHATQPSGGGGNWDHTFTVNVATDGGFTGTNVITGLDAGNIVTVNETVSGQITDNNHDGIKEVTLAAIRPNGFYTFNWSVTDAPMNGTIDSMTVGTVSYVTAQDWAGGELPITFTARCSTPRPRRSAHHTRTRWSTRTTTASTSPAPRTLASRRKAGRDRQGRDPGRPVQRLKYANRLRVR
jgi:hypothetical protein